MKKLNEKELVEVKGGFSDTNMIYNQSFFILRNFKLVKHAGKGINWKKIFGIK